MSTTKQYSLTIKRVPPLPRNERLRLAKAAGSPLAAVGAGAQASEAAAAGASHTHDNKAVLDRLNAADGYLYIKETRVEYDGSEVSAQQVEAKAKAGYADEAGSLSDWADADARYVSKTGDDAVAGVLRFAQRAEFGGYAPGAAGGMIGMAAGGSAAEVDYLRVRRKAQFETLEIAEAKAVGGKLIVSPGDGVQLTSAELTADGWLCRYKSDEVAEDGSRKSAPGKFCRGDQLYSQEADLSAGLQTRYWWRLVVDCGDGWVLLSADDCAAGSDDPQAGDKCAQLGSRRDPQRQAAIVLAASEPAAAPQLALYGGIDRYSLEGKACVEMGAGVDGVPYLDVRGKAVVGDPGGGYLRFDPAGGLEVRGRITADSSVDGMSLADWAAKQAANKAAADGILTPAEKRQLLTLISQIRQEFGDLYGAAEAAGCEDAAEDYADAYASLMAYLTGAGDCWLLGEDGEPIELEDGVFAPGSAPYIEEEAPGILYPLNEDTEIDRAELDGLLAEYQRTKDELPGRAPIYDHTKTAIDGGIITSGTLQLASDTDRIVAGITGYDATDEAVRIWAGDTFANRAAAPYRVTQGGKVTATEANIKGGINADRLTMGCAVANNNDTLTGSFYIVHAEDAPLLLLPQIGAGEARAVDIMVLDHNGQVVDGTPVMTLEGDGDAVKVIQRGRYWDDKDSITLTGAAGHYRLTGFRPAGLATTTWAVSIIDGDVPAGTMSVLPLRPGSGKISDWEIKF